VNDLADIAEVIVHSEERHILATTLRRVGNAR
jgi:hypothetical protein